MKTLTICQRKGGNGKSTSALNLSYAFSLMGKKVLLIDLDEQRNTTSAVKTKEAVYETAETLLRSGEAEVRDVAAATEWENVDLIGASGSLSGAVRALDADVGSHGVLREKLGVCKKYDVCIIDTPPSLNTLTVNALCASDFLFIPLSSKYFSLQGLTATLDAYEKVKARLHPPLTLAGMAFVIHDMRSNLAKEAIGKTRETYKELVFQTIIGQNIKIEEAQTEQQSVLQYAPKSRGAMQYRALAAELSYRLFGGGND